MGQTLVIVAMLSKTTKISPKHLFWRLCVLSGVGGAIQGQIHASLNNILYTVYTILYIKDYLHV